MRTVPLAVVLSLAVSLLTPWLFSARAQVSSSRPGEIEILAAESVFAVVTQKAGIGAKLAHNHLIVAEGYRASLSFDGADPASTTFELVAPVDGLVVDRADLQAIWGPRVQALGLVGESFQTLSDKDRGKIRKSMLSKGQLAVDSNSELRARILGVEATAGETLGDSTFDWKVRLEVTLKGKAVETTAVARYEVPEGESGPLEFEAIASFRFTDFGIEPYSALLGAIRNDDEFHVYVFVKGAVR